MMLYLFPSVRSYALSGQSVGNNLPNYLLHDVEPFLRKNIDVPSPLKKIVGKAASD